MSEHVSLSHSQVMLSKPLVQHTSVDFTGARTRRNSREPVTHRNRTPRALTSREWISKCLICTNNSTRTRRFPQTLSNSLVFVRIDWIKANRCVYWGDGVLSLGVIMDWTSLRTWNERKTHTYALFWSMAKQSRQSERFNELCPLYFPSSTYSKPWKNKVLWAVNNRALCSDEQGHI